MDQTPPGRKRPSETSVVDRALSPLDGNSRAERSPLPIKAAASPAAGSPTQQRVLRSARKGGAVTPSKQSAGLVSHDVAMSSGPIVLTMAKLEDEAERPAGESASPAPPPLLTMAQLDHGAFTPLATAQRAATCADGVVAGLSPCEALAAGAGATCCGADVAASLLGGGGAGAGTSNSWTPYAAHPPSHAASAMAPSAPLPLAFCSPVLDPDSFQSSSTPASTQTPTLVPPASHSVLTGRTPATPWSALPPPLQTLAVEEAADQGTVSGLTPVVTAHMARAADAATPLPIPAAAPILTPSAALATAPLASPVTMSEAPVVLTAQGGEGEQNCGAVIVTPESSGLLPVGAAVGDKASELQGCTDLRGTCVDKGTGATSFASVPVVSASSVAECDAVTGSATVLAVQYPVSNSRGRGAPAFGAAPSSPSRFSLEFKQMMAAAAAFDGAASAGAASQSFEMPHPPIVPVTDASAHIADASPAQAPAASVLLPAGGSPQRAAAVDAALSATPAISPCRAAEMFDAGGTLRPGALSCATGSSKKAARSSGGAAITGSAGSCGGLAWSGGRLRQRALQSPQLPAPPIAHLLNSVTQGLFGDETDEEEEGGAADGCAPMAVDGAEGTAGHQAAVHGGTPATCVTPAVASAAAEASPDKSHAAALEACLSPLPPVATSARSGRSRSSGGTTPRSAGGGAGGLPPKSPHFQPSALRQSTVLSPVRGGLTSPLRTSPRLAMQASPLAMQTSPGTMQAAPASHSPGGSQSQSSLDIVLATLQQHGVCLRRSASASPSPESKPVAALMPLTPAVQAVSPLVGMEGVSGAAVLSQQGGGAAVQASASARLDLTPGAMTSRQLLSPSAPEPTPDGVAAGAEYAFRQPGSAAGTGQTCAVAPAVPLSSPSLAGSPCSLQSWQPKPSPAHSQPVQTSAAAASNASTEREELSFRLNDVGTGTPQPKASPRPIHPAVSPVAAATAAPAPSNASTEQEELSFRLQDVAADTPQTHTRGGAISTAAAPSTANPISPSVSMLGMLPARPAATPMSTAAHAPATAPPVSVAGATAMLSPVPLALNSGAAAAPHGSAAASGPQVCGTPAMHSRPDEPPATAGWTPTCSQLGDMRVCPAKVPAADASIGNDPGTREATEQQQGSDGSGAPTASSSEPISSLVLTGAHPDGDEAGGAGLPDKSEAGVGGPSRATASAQPLPGSALAVGRAHATSGSPTPSAAFTTAAGPVPPAAAVEATPVSHAALSRQLRSSSAATAAAPALAVLGQAVVNIAVSGGALAVHASPVAAAVPAVQAVRSPRAAAVMATPMSLAQPAMPTVSQLGDHIPFSLPAASTLGDHVPPVLPSVSQLGNHVPPSVVRPGHAVGNGAAASPASGLPAGRTPAALQRRQDVAGVPPATVDPGLATGRRRRDVLATPASNVVCKALAQGSADGKELQGLLMGQGSCPRPAPRATDMTPASHRETAAAGGGGKAAASAMRAGLHTPTVSQLGGSGSSIKPTAQVALLSVDAATNTGATAVEREQLLCVLDAPQAAQNCGNGAHGSVPKAVVCESGTSLSPTPGSAAPQGFDVGNGDMPTAMQRQESASKPPATGVCAAVTPLPDAQRSVVKPSTRGALQKGAATPAAAAATATIPNLAAADTAADTAALPPGDAASVQKSGAAGSRFLCNVAQPTIDECRSEARATHALSRFAAAGAAVVDETISEVVELPKAPSAGPDVSMSLTPAQSGCTKGPDEAAAVGPDPGGEVTAVATEEVVGGVNVDPGAVDASNAVCDAASDQLPMSAQPVVEAEQALPTSAQPVVDAVQQAHEGQVAPTAADAADIVPPAGAAGPAGPANRKRAASSKGAAKKQQPLQPVAGSVTELPDLAGTTAGIVHEPEQTAAPLLQEQPQSKGAEGTVAAPMSAAEVQLSLLATFATASADERSAAVVPTKRRGARRAAAAPAVSAPPMAAEVEASHADVAATLSSGAPTGLSVQRSTRGGASAVSKRRQAAGSSLMGQATDGSGAAEPTAVGHPAASAQLPSLAATTPATAVNRCDSDACVVSDLRGGRRGTAKGRKRTRAAELPEEVPATASHGNDADDDAPSGVPPPSPTGGRRKRRKAMDLECQAAPIGAETATAQPSPAPRRSSRKDKAGDAAAAAACVPDVQAVGDGSEAAFVDMPKVTPATRRGTRRDGGGGGGTGGRQDGRTAGVDAGPSESLTPGATGRRSTRNGKAAAAARSLEATPSAAERRSTRKGKAAAATAATPQAAAGGEEAPAAAAPTPGGAMRRSTRSCVVGAAATPVLGGGAVAGEAGAPPVAVPPVATASLDAAAAGRTSAQKSSGRRAAKLQEAVVPLVKQTAALPAVPDPEQKACPAAARVRRGGGGTVAAAVLQWENRGGASVDVSAAAGAAVGGKRKRAVAADPAPGEAVPASAVAAADGTEERPRGRGRPGKRQALDAAAQEQAPDSSARVQLPDELYRRVTRAHGTAGEMASDAVASVGNAVGGIGRGAVKAAAAAAEKQEVLARAVAIAEAAAAAVGRTTSRRRQG